MSDEKAGPTPTDKPRPWFELTVVVLFVVFLFYVPMQRCPTCSGRGEVSIRVQTEDAGADATDAGAGRTLRCRECGGPGRLTTYQILYGLVDP